MFVRFRYRDRLWGVAGFQTSLVSLVSSSRKDITIENTVPKGTTFGTSKYEGGTNLELSIIGEGEDCRVCFVIDPNKVIGQTEKSEMVATSGGFKPLGLPNGKQLRINLNVIG